MKRLSPTEDAMRDSPSREYAFRHPLDILLRKEGWRIEHRPRVGEAIWRGPDGEVLPFHDAIDKALGTEAAAEVEAA